MKTFKRLIATMLSAVVMTTSMAINTLAISDGTYTLKTNTYYLNPDTGKTDDGGTSNVALGEGMCRSSVFETAEVTQNGDNTTIILTMLLYSNLSNIRIAVQEEPKGEYTNVDYSVLKESSSTDSADIQFSMPNIDNYVQIKMYVAPMGRDVCFYLKLDTSSNVSTDTKVEEKVFEKEESPLDLFSDINNHWAEEAIKTVVSKGLFSGTSDTTFSPDNEMTRGMFVTVLGRLSGENITGTSNFSDVSNTAYYSPYIAWANSKGIVSGTSSTTFSPDTPVTCEQAAVILVKYAQYKNVTLAEKSISPSTTGVSQWATENVIKAGKSGIITKQNTNGYNYTSSATRADVASMLSNYIEYYTA